MPPTVVAGVVEFTEPTVDPELNVAEPSGNIAHGPDLVALEGIEVWRPGTFKLGALRDARLRLIQAIDIAETREDGQVAVEAPEFNEFGWGANFTEALVDLQHALAELYWGLETERERLGPGMHALWERLREKIRRV
jgi:hypothetical protein